MRTLLDMRIPLAWFMLVLILVAAGGIVWLIAVRSSAPANAVLIAGVPSPATERTPVALGVLSNDSSVVPRDTPPAATTPQALVVYVSGEVIAPGVYTLPLGSRVADAVAASGGFTEQANREGINLAARLSDEQHISVPKIGEVALHSTIVPTVASQADKEVPVDTATPPSASTVKVNINTATAKELEALPGIGEVLSKRIVTDREANGPFKVVDDLMRVPGIKDGLMSQLRDLVTVGP
ncbi:MAG: helix-hairpin-helix domain-containing protein [Chloroflexota bacterium]|nr:helix-hairpin-helix domain-containing protein [Chloroflexota bacterium]MDQ5864646.1 helix-hairpin-helix domain-containing protein [Chloroflexota bacterium]